MGNPEGETPLPTWGMPTHGVQHRAYRAAHWGSFSAYFFLFFENIVVFWNLNLHFEYVCCNPTGPQKFRRTEAACNERAVKTANLSLTGEQWNEVLEYTISLRDPHPTPWKAIADTHIIICKWPLPLGWLGGCPKAFCPLGDR